MVADIMVVIHLSSVCNLVNGDDLSLASSASRWKQSNKIKRLFSQFVMQEFILTHVCGNLQFSLFFK